MKSKKLKTGIVAALVLVVILVGVYLFRGGEGKATSYRLAKVEQGPIRSVVSSTGTLNAVITVQVGSQISGQIKELVADFNSEVRAGDLIARINPEIFEARVKQAEAELSVAKANVVIQRANVEKARTDLDNATAALAASKAQTEKARVVVADAKRTLDRRRELQKKGAISENEMDAAQAGYDQAFAQLRSAEAQEQAEASLVSSRDAALRMAKAQVDYALEQVKQREAALMQSRVDLENTFIRSPVDGTVIERNVDVGQTVAASLQAPKLFVIAQDLRKMQVETNVDEADIGRIRVGQRATFTVDAFPGKEFGGEVRQIRKAPQTVQNVVTYTVVVSAENPDLRLLPGMTANVQLIVDERTQALKIPNAALRFRPAGEEGGPSPTGGEVRSAGSPGFDGPGQGAERLKRLTEALQLDQEQEKQVGAIFEQVRERVAKLRQQGATPEEIRAEAQAMRERNRHAILALLTPEQREKYQRLFESRVATPVTKGRLWTLSKEGKPVPADVATGINDGNFTELVGGDLRAGQEVIVGTNQVDKKAASKGTGRFLF
jgi:HlyD family secretion protein